MRAECGDLIVVQVQDLGGMADKSGWIGSEKHLTIANAEDDGATVARHDELAWSLGIHHR
jgi:hypothetical protein